MNENKLIIIFFVIIRILIIVLIIITIAVVVITLGDKGTGFSAICAWTYLVARILYIPAYYFGLAPWRSLIWFAGFTSTMLMILSALI